MNCAIKKHQQIIIVHNCPSCDQQKRFLFNWENDIFAKISVNFIFNNESLQSLAPKICPKINYVISVLIPAGTNHRLLKYTELFEGQMSFLLNVFSSI